ncbi:glycosyltransferase [Poseidonibacter lekithochrous]|uniref:glycosyltransferase n=1 Tax=Poseidonibacter lekithochrous TaxID=1904463 RepID=UPI0008FCB210|nr:glycosyltransferase [Poseidonibacter lekithochrous]QKJ23781.1 glycosyltransferase, family 1 [Poseidonibacter lekithochrous]
MNKNILFVYDYLYTGGIETLILRMSKWLISQGYSVSIILRKRGEIADLLDPKIEVIELGKYYRYLYLPFISRKVSQSNNFEKFDYIMSFHPRSNWIASNLIDNLNLKCKYITGVYHPRAYFNKDLHLSEKLCYKYLLDNQENKSILFMNEDTKKHHSDNLNSDFNSSPIWPLPVADKENSSKKPYKKYKFISIGRFAKFKTYNLYMIDIINNLVKKGYDIHYDIYGTGELEPYMKKKIAEYSLEKRIILHGNLSYSNFSKVLEDAYLFIGMGTSVVEASFSKVPSLVAIENSKDSKSYGFLNDLPYYNVGERNNSLEEKDVETMISELLLKSDEEYNEICEKSYSYVQEYSLSALMPKWLKQINEIRKEEIKIDAKYKYLYLFLELMNPILKIFKRKKILQ